MGRTLAAVFALLLAACGSESAATTTSSSTTTTEPLSPIATTSTTTIQSESVDMEVTSPDFGQGQAIPGRFTCDGDDVSPGLVISGIPEGTATLALIVDDPDAPGGTWDHWVAYDIPVAGTQVTIPEATGPGGTQGVNSWNLTGYGGPCPPDGEHRYFFRVFALDTALLIPEGIGSGELRTAMEGRILDQAALMGTYRRGA